MSDTETNGTSRSRATMSHAEVIKLGRWMEERREELIDLPHLELSVRMSVFLGKPLTAANAAGMRTNLEWPDRRTGKEDDALQLRLRLDDLEARVAKLEGKEPTFEPHEHER